MMREWEVHASRTVDEAAKAATEADVMLVDFGTTDEGIAIARALWEQGVAIPCLVIGDRATEEEARAGIITRPFTLVDLSEAFQKLLKGERVEPAKADPAELPIRPAAKAPAQEPARAGSKPAEEKAPDDGAASPSPTPVAAPTEPEPTAREAGVTEQRSGSPAIDEGETIPSDAVGEDEAHLAPPPPTSASEAIPARAPERGEMGGVIRRFLQRRSQPVAREPVAEELDAGPREDPMTRRLREALAGGRGLESLLDELPVLTEARAMGHAFLAEVVEMFRPETAALYTAASDGSFRVLAAHGLSSAELSLRVPPDQPLFLEVTNGLEAMLIAPLDLARGLVAGIGGTSTDAMIAAPLEVEGICYGLVIVGRPDFTEFDLEVLAEAAAEAAPGLAVAQVVERLRSR